MNNGFGSTGQFGRYQGSYNQGRYMQGLQHWGQGQLSGGIMPTQGRWQGGYPYGVGYPFGNNGYGMGRYGSNGMGYNQQYNGYGSNSYGRNYGNNGYGGNGYGSNGFGNNGFGNNGYNQGGQYGMVVGTNGYGQQQGQYGQYAQSRY